MSDFEFELLSWLTILLLFVTTIISLVVVIEYGYTNPGILDSTLLMKKYREV